ncbi:MAG: helix-turn-helix domain-containing protein [Candidatus Wallacebacter cryptica]
MRTIAELNYDFHIETRKRDAFNMNDKHRHEPYEIYYLRAGERYYFIDDRIYHVNQGDLIFVPSNVLHRTTAANNEQHERTVLYFKDRFLADLVPQSAHLMDCFYRETKVVRPKVAEQMQIENTLAKLSTEYGKSLPHSALYLKALLIELLVLANRIEPAEPNLYDSLSPIHEKIHKIVRYLRKNYQSAVTLAQLGDKFYISQYYLSRMFKEVTGLTLIEYLNTVRVQEAQKLLTSSDLSITEISGLVGYENQTYFGRIFKRITGLTPSEYRRQSSAG